MKACAALDGFWLKVWFNGAPQLKPLSHSVITMDTPMDTLLYSSHGKPKLLVVDDQPVNIQVMHQVFAQDYQVFMATSGAQALALCQNNPPDLVLLDVVMPGVMDGLAATRAIRALPGREAVPILAMTANAFEEDRRRCAEAGMDIAVKRHAVDAAVLHRVFLKF